MFTGIIEKIGKVESLTKDEVSHKLCIDFDGFNSSLGDSLCVNGVCLTVENINNSIYILAFHLKLIIFLILNSLIKETL